MKGFEYGVYSPGDMALPEGSTEWKTISSYDHKTAWFTDGSSADTDLIKQVRIIRQPDAGDR